MSSERQEPTEKKERPVIGFGEMVIVTCLIAIQTVLAVLFIRGVLDAYAVPIIVIIILLSVPVYALSTGKLKLFGRSNTGGPRQRGED